MIFISMQQCPQKGGTALFSHMNNETQGHRKERDTCSPQGVAASEGWWCHSNSNYSDFSNFRDFLCYTQLGTLNGPPWCERTQPCICSQCHGFLSMLCPSLACGLIKLFSAHSAASFLQGCWIPILSASRREESVTMTSTTHCKPNSNHVPRPCWM